MNYERVPVLLPSKRLIALAVGIIAAFVLIVVFAADAHAVSQGKVFVCKYVGTPGADERLQTGQNPISVSVNAIPDGAAVGAYFADAQGRSFVLAFDVGQPEPDASECPGQEQPSSEPSTTPSEAPSTAPSVEPSVTPSVAPSADPTPTPTSSGEPTGAPSPTPTTTPTFAPSSSPTTPSVVVPQTDTATSDPAPQRGNPGWLAVAAALSAVTASTLLRRPNPARIKRR